MEQHLVPGVEVDHAGRRWRVLRPLGPDAVLLGNEAGETVSADPVRVSACGDGLMGNPKRIVDEVRYTEAQWAEAARRRDIVVALHRLPTRTRASVEAAAAAIGIKQRQLWSILRDAAASGFAITAFLPRDRSRRTKRLDPGVEAIVTLAIDQHYAKTSRPTLASLHARVDGDCQAAGLASPSYRTIQARVDDRDQAWLTRRRAGPKSARALRLLTGSHPGAAAPWERVQIDSTPCDIRLVRETDRTIIGRPNVTFALDLYSRVVLGFSTSLDGASTVTTATCLEHACLPKEDWLARRGLGRLHWPVYGRPAILECDQGPEDEAHGIQRGLKLHGIKVKIRAKGHPEQHGHIERLIGTMMRMVHELPGTTFSNINERGESEPDKLACLSLPELEQVLALAIDSYNHTTHGTTGERPMDGYLAWYRRPDLADAERIPPRMPATLLRDFLPFERRGLTRTGFRLFRVDYSSVDLLPLWRRDNRNRVERVVVYDPRSLKEVWVADEASGDYIAAPYRIPHPDMTLAESIEARAAFRTAKARDRTEQRLFDNLADIRAIVAKAKTTTARRKAERTLQARRSVRERAVAASPEIPASQPAEGAAGKLPAWAGTDVAPFADVERL
jgi:putative transposase